VGAIGELEGKKVVIVGGTRGIGFATAQMALAAGAEVVIASRDPAKVAAATATLHKVSPGKITGDPVDVTDRAGIRRFLERHAPFDHLCLPGSQAYRMRFEETDEAEARAFFDQKFWGPFFAVFEARTFLRVGGSAVLYSGAASRRPLSGYVVGAAIDGAIDALTRSLALELARYRLRVNAISPGIIETDVTRLNRTQEEFEAWRDHHAARLPVGRIGRPEECAGAALYLMTNGFVTGQVLNVDGGLESIP
jgi:NAD(P)-dependent dehydrogenase (short-subunit alcohol dehydrogenase family)